MKNRWPNLYKLFQNDDDLPYPFVAEDYHKFDGRDCISMDYTIVAYIYEGLHVLLEAPIDWTFHKFNINGETLTNEECIRRMIHDCKLILTLDDLDNFEEMDAAKNDLFTVMKECFWTLWC